MLSRYKRFALLALLILGVVVSRPTFAETNRQAICAIGRYCSISSPSCGAGATCITSPAIQTACGSTVGDANAITTSGDGRCLTPTQQTCLTDSTGCLDRDANAPPASGATTICCNCLNGSQQMCAQFTDVSQCNNVGNSQSYQTIAGQTPNPLVNFNCTGAPLSPTQCRPTAQNGICQQGPSPLSTLISTAAAPAAQAPTPANVPANVRPAVIPQLGVPIPGLTFSPPDIANRSVHSNFLAQYIAAFYRIGIQVALVAATIMVVYGGFRYLIGSGAGDIKTGKTIIQDAIIGLLIALSAYVILNTVNPATLDLESASISTIDAVNLNDLTFDGMPMQDAPGAGDTVAPGSAPAAPAAPRSGSNIPAAACNRDFIRIDSIAGIDASRFSGASHMIHRDLSENLVELSRGLAQIDGHILISDTTRTQAAQSIRHIQIKAACGDVYAGVPAPSNRCGAGGHGAGRAIDLSLNGHYCRIDGQNTNVPAFMEAHGWVRLCVERWHYEPLADHTGRLQNSVGGSHCFGGGNDDLAPIAPREHCF